MTRSIKTSSVDIHIQIIESNKEPRKLIMLKIGDNCCWQEVTLPSEIVKDKFTDSKFWTHLINFFIKD